MLHIFTYNSYRSQVLLRLYRRNLTHFNLFGKLLVQHFTCQIGELLNELKDIFQGIYLIKDLSQKTSDTIVSYGERLSSIIVAELTGAEWFDSRKFIKTEKKHSKYVLDTELTNELIRETFSTLPKRALVPGFISTDKVTGDVTNLGRGGSDYTASVIAAALDADQLEIWTDVDGFMTADPRVISTAYTINELSYVEATELCNFGAKVVYPPNFITFISFITIDKVDTMCRKQDVYTCIDLN